MNKLMIIAATSMLAFSIGPVFAHAADASAQQSTMTEARSASQPPANGSHLLFSASGRQQVDVYGVFPDGSGGLRGN